MVTAATLSKEFDAFVSFVRSLPGEARDGMSWPQFAAYLSDNGDTVLPLFQEVVHPPGAVTPPLDPPTLGTTYGKWSEGKRRKANLDALRALAVMRADGRSIPTPEERVYLQAFSGWGGVDILKLPADSTIFSPEYVDAIEQFQAAAEGRGVPTTNLFVGLKHQYFTPLAVGRAMWTLAQRAAQMASTPFKNALEPSAGVGRFLQAAPSDENVAWAAVESDPLLVQFLDALYPVAEVVPSHFESFAVTAAKQGRQWDLVVSNPPFPTRSRADRKLDADFSAWSEGHHYFTIRAASLLRPGGVLVTITPLGQINGESEINRTMRRWLFEWCHFAGALVPPANLFPGVLVNFAIHVWIRKAPLLAGATYRPTPEESRLINGDYLETAAGKENVMGDWIAGRYPGQVIVKGVFDEAFAALAPLRPLPANEIAAIRTWRRDNPAPSITSTRRQPSTPSPSYQEQGSGIAVVPAPPTVDPGDALVDTTSTVSVAVREAVALAFRIGRFQVAARSQGSSAVAESGRSELRRDVLRYVDTYGNPHANPDLRSGSARKNTAPLLGAVRKDGSLVPMLTQPVSPRDANAPPENATLLQVVEWYSKQNGVCTERDIARHYQGGNDVLDALLAVPTIAVAPSQHFSGEFDYFRLNEEYLTGNLYNRLDWLEEQLDAGVEIQPALLERYTFQRRKLMEVINPRSLADIEVTPRSGFVPLSVLAAYTNARLLEIAELTEWSSSETVELSVEQGLLRAQTHDLLDSAQQKWLIFLLGYYNRQLQAVDPDQAGDKRYGIYEGKDAGSRLNEDRDLEEDFAQWLVADEEARTEVEEGYNRLHAYYPRSYDDGPLPLVRISPELAGDARKGEAGLNPHQNAAVRRITDRRSGIIAHDVGAGKCVEGSTSVLTSQGLVRIDSLFGDQKEGPEDELVLLPPPGLKVLSHVEGHPVWQPVRALYRQRLPEDEHVWELETQRGGFTGVTGRHPFPVVRTGQLEWTPTAQISEGDWLAVAARIPEPEQPFEIEADLVTLLTWQVAEGCEPAQTPGANTVIITQKDGAVLSRLLGCFRRLYPEAPEQTARILSPKNRASYLSICYAPYRKRLEALGYVWGNRSAGKQFPSWFITLPTETLRSMLRDFMDAEGSVSRHTVEVSSASHALLIQIRYALLRFGVRATLRSKQARATNGKNIWRTYWRLQFSGADAEAYAEHVGFGVPGKASRLQEVKNKPRNPNVGLPVRDILDSLTEVGITWKALGIDRCGKLQTVSVETARALAQRMRWMASELGVAHLNQRAQSLGGTAGSYAKRTYQAASGNAGLLDLLADRLEGLLSLDMRFERVVRVEPGTVGGFVYDLEVGADNYDAQNYVAGDGALIAHNTYTALALAAYWRQINRAYKPIVVMPLSVLTNWYNECRRLLPDFRIGTIGLTLDLGKGVRHKDTADERREKWHRYMQGGYDLLLVPYPSFLRDIELGDSAVHEILGRVLWLQRSAGLDAETRDLYKRKVEHAQAAIEKWTNEITELKADLDRGYRMLGKEKDRYVSIYAEEQEKVENMIARKERSIVSKQAVIEEWRESSKKPTSNMIEQVRSDLEDFTQNKPFRPRHTQRPWTRSQSKRALYDIATEEFVPGLQDWSVYAKREGPGKQGIVDLLMEHLPPPAKGEEVREPLPGLVTWEELGCDLLIVDEAHNFKNLWQPACRLGVDKIVYMGGCSEQLTQRAWDMYLKAQYLLGQHNDTGVVLLTATPVKNSPLEVYNLLSLVGQRIWEDRKVMNKEEFIDRYIGLMQQVTMQADLKAEINLAVKSFKNLDELRAIMDIYMDRQTTDDLLASGALKSVPRAEVWGAPRADVSLRQVADHEWISMDAHQERIYIALQDMIEEEQKKLKELEAKAGAFSPEAAAAKAAQGALVLYQMDMLGKAALDPRLLTEDVGKVMTRIEANEVSTKRLEAGKKLRKTDPIPMTEQQKDNLDRRLDLLLGLELEQVEQAYGIHGKIPPKFEVLADYIRGRPDCGHVVFSDYNATHAWIVDALTQRGGIDPDRIVTLDASVGASERTEIAEAFNGRKRRVIAGIEIEPGVAPRYDVIIGNSGVMAEGMNLQARTCAIHHMTLPWEPATLHQRNGRGVRQGNSFDAVAVRFYVAKKSFDGFKLDYVLGKKGWQETLFDPDARTVDLSGGVGREELSILLTARNEDEAREKWALVKAQQEALLLELARQDAVRRFTSLVSQYVRARRTAKPEDRQAIFALGDVSATKLRTLPDNVFPDKRVIELAREHVTYYDPGSGFWAQEGERLCVSGVAETKAGATETQAGPLRKVEILTVRPPARGQRNWIFYYRSFGQALRQISIGPGGLTGVGATAGMIPQRINLEDCGGWDDTEDVKAVVQSIDNVDKMPSIIPTLLTSLGQHIWQSLVSSAAGSRGYLASMVLAPQTQGFTPLVPKNEDTPSRVLLVSADAVETAFMGDARSDLLVLFTEEYRLLLPNEWSEFARLLARDEAYVLHAQDRWRGGALTERAADPDDTAHTTSIAKLAGRWFRKAERVPAGVRKKWRASHVRKLKQAAKEAEEAVRVSNSTEALHRGRW